MIAPLLALNPQYSHAAPQSHPLCLVLGQTHGWSLVNECGCELNELLPMLGGNKNPDFLSGLGWEPNYPPFLLPHIAKQILIGLKSSAVPKVGPTQSLQSVFSRVMWRAKG